MKLTLVTGNKHKREEWRRLLPAHIELETHDADLIEIQTADAEELVADKVKRAYELLKKPVVVEDVSAGLNELNGLPGPLIKFFVGALGREALSKLARNLEDRTGYAAATVGFYDGQKLVIVTGRVDGTVTEPRGENGFGFDYAFIPDGQTKTYGEMTPAEKDKISHRVKAVQLLVQALKAYGK